MYTYERFIFLTRQNSVHVFGIHCLWQSDKGRKRLIHLHSDQFTDVPCSSLCNFLFVRFCRVFFQRQYLSKILPHWFFFCLVEFKLPAFIFLFNFLCVLLDLFYSERWRSSLFWDSFFFFFFFFQWRKSRLNRETIVVGCGLWRQTRSSAESLPRRWNAETSARTGVEFVG